MRLNLRTLPVSCQRTNIGYSGCIMKLFLDDFAAHLNRGPVSNRPTYGVR